MKWDEVRETRQRAILSQAPGTPGEGAETSGGGIDPLNHREEVSHTLQMGEEIVRGVA